MTCFLTFPTAVFVTLAMFCLMVSAFTSCIRLALSDVGGSKCLYLWNSYLLITSAVLMLLSVVVWITSCQNNFVSYLDTIGQTPELMNRVTLWSRYIEVGCILAIVSTVSCNKPALRACLRLQNNWKCNIFRVLPTSHTAWKRAFWT